MMKNKILIELIVPDLEENYSLYIPITKRIGDIINLLIKAISEFNNCPFKNNPTVALYNANTGTRYEPNDLVINTDIRNGTQLVLI